MKTSHLKYIVVAGNSGAGKSTLLQALSEVFHERRMAGIGKIDVCDEKKLKHDLLIRQFEDPAHWALPMQLAYMTERYAYVRAAAESAQPGTLLLMERCLWEDRLFCEYYLRRDLIPSGLRSAYNALNAGLRDQTPKPHIIIHLRAPAPWLHTRLERAFKNGDRLVELLGDPLMRYLSGINELYTEWCSEARTITPYYFEYDVTAIDFDVQSIVQRVTAQFRDSLRMTT